MRANVNYLPVQSPSCEVHNLESIVVVSSHQYNLLRFLFIMLAKHLLWAKHLLPYGCKNGKAYYM